LDVDLVWNRKAPEIKILTEVFAGLQINSLAFIRPAEPYRTIIGFLARHAGGLIEPRDCETRTFLHALPVARQFTSAAVINALKHSKSVILAPGDPTCSDGPAIVASGTVSPEQGFVVVSSVCFACFVKFFADFLEALRSGHAQAEYHQAFERVMSQLGAMDAEAPALMKAPFMDEAAVFEAIDQAGRNTVTLQLVDSYFGNVSYRWKSTLYISQTGSSLDELKGCVDPVPLDGSTSAGLTASSELSAHMDVIARTGCQAILHGHPRFAVILSMDCAPQDKARCKFVDQCHLKCPQPRFAAGVPIVPGEVGTGPSGLCHTLPPAIEKHGSAIVYGHGLFTTGRRDFNEAFGAMLKIEKDCRAKYFNEVNNLRRRLA
jgi:ribulose-5-phosphate 4-epimerase/fuculose-1-phosphate aldolase